MLIIWFLVGLPKWIRRELKSTEDYDNLKIAMSDAMREEDDGSDGEDPQERRVHRTHQETKPSSDSQDLLWKSEMELLNEKHQQQMEKLTKEFQNTLKLIQSTISSQLPTGQELHRRENNWCPHCAGPHT